MSDYAVIVIGGGVSGASIAWWLSRYDLKVALLDKNADVGFGVSKANSGIVHGGFHHSAAKTLKAKLEVRGNLMFEQLQNELDFPFRRDGILVAAFSQEDMAAVNTLYRQGLDNGVRTLELCGRDRMLKLEPVLNPEVIGGLHAPGGGTVEPYRFVFALTEAARRNGVDLFCNCEVSGGVYNSAQKLWQVSIADQRTFSAQYIINAAGLFADQVSHNFGAEDYTITPRKGEEYLLDRECPSRPTKVVFPAPSRVSKGVLVIPTAEGTTMIGPTADSVPDKTDLDTTADHRLHIFDLARRLVPALRERDLIAAFAGLRPTLPGDDFYIDFSQQVPQFIQVAGIQSPGLTAAPAIGEYVKDLLKTAGLTLTEKTTAAAPPRRHELRYETPDSLAQLHDSDPRWTHVVCRCESISEAEIVAAIHAGHTTLDGIKFYTRAGMGRCQGGFCTPRILEIIARETGQPMDQITKRGGASKVLAGHLGDLPVIKQEISV